MNMNIAFCLFKYFPYGGLQRDFLRIAETCQQRGHTIHVYTMSWEGDCPAGFNVHLIKPRGLQNHTRCASFIQQVQQEWRDHPHDLIIGFNKMPGLDVYYAADVCYQARIREQRRFFYRCLPRYRQWLANERAVFMKGQATQIMLISPLQQPVFISYYQTEAERFHLLPPGIARDRIAPAHAGEIRNVLRQMENVAPDDYLLLMVGSGFKTKGLDRTIMALAALPAALKKRCQLFVIGQDDSRYFERLARRLQIDSQLRFLGGRDDVADFLLAADVLLHPAYHENTGTVLLEALVAGLPVLTIDHCGYAHYIREANSGIVLHSPFQQAELNAALQWMLTSSKEALWRRNALTYANQADLYSMPMKAADFIEQMGRKRGLIFTSSH